ncbi:MAG TPA: bile acid:sodium symporter [Gemmataceae bacterium]
MTTQQVVGLVNVTALAAIMLSIGLQVTVAAVVAAARSAGRVALGVAANFVLVPAVTLGLLRVVQPEPLVAVGFLILAVCPGAPVGPPATAIGRGDVPWAVGLMVILGGLSAVLSPALLGLFVPWVAPDSALAVDSLGIVRTLLLAQLLPLTVGLAVRHVAPAVTARIARPIGLLANVLLAVLIGLILATQFDTLAAIRAGAWVGMLVLFLASVAIGWVCVTGGGATRKASALTTAARNAAVGLAIATGNFAGTPAVTAVVAYGLVSMLGTLAGGVVFGRLAAPGLRTRLTAP